MNPDLMKDFLLETFPNPDRKGCPEDKTLEALAEDRLPSDTSVRLHVGSCSECYAEYRHYRLDWEEARATEAAKGVATADPTDLQRVSSNPLHQALRSRSIPFALAASMIVMCGSGYIAFKHYHPGDFSKSQIADAHPINATLDLFNNGTLRGADDEALPLREVSLPAAVVHLSVILPRFSDTGRYSVSVSKDRDGSRIVATGTGTASSMDDGKVSVNVTLDLRNASSGAYFLATVRGTDNGAYYYPLKVN